MDLTETEDIKKRWQEYTEKLYKKVLHDPDNHDGMITDLEPDILVFSLASPALAGGFFASNTTWEALIVGRRHGNNTQKNYTKRIFMTQIITMV